MKSLVSLFTVLIGLLLVGCNVTVADNRSLYDNNQKKTQDEEYEEVRLPNYQGEFFQKSFIKIFEKTSYPYDKVRVIVTVAILFPDDDLNRAKESHMANNLRKITWKKLEENNWCPYRSLRHADIHYDAGRIELSYEQGFRDKDRVRAYLSLNNKNTKYRGGSIDEFVQEKIIDKLEYELTYEFRLKGKNWPY